MLHGHNVVVLNNTLNNGHVTHSPTQKKQIQTNKQTKKLLSKQVLNFFFFVLPIKIGL